MVVRKWVWLQCSWWVSGVVRRYIDFLILLISTPLVLALFASVSRLICSFVKKIILIYVTFVQYNKRWLAERHSRSLKN